MIELTEQQRQELLATDIPRALDPGTGQTYVLVPTEVYERLNPGYRRRLERQMQRDEGRGFLFHP